MKNDNNNSNSYTNGHNDSLNEQLSIPIKQENISSIQPHITNVLTSLNNNKQWNNHQINNNHISPPTTTTRYILFRFSI